MREEFAKHGLETSFVQVNNSLSTKKGTLRGLHYQLAPREEVKLVRCIRGAVFDLLLDLRPNSATYKQHYGLELNQENRTMLYIPKGCAHGFMTITTDSELLYLVSEYYSKELERGVRWNDPAFNIQWPQIPEVLSERDCQHASYISL